jgi:glycerol-3-phosphate acyltransferase PlsY
MAAMASDAAAFAAVVAAYGLGTFPTATLVGRSFGHDPSREGSGNPGASNVYRLAGRRAATLVFAGDFLKGVAAAALGAAVSGRTLALACGAAAVVGHCYPVTRGFRGGKGVATGVGFVTLVFPAAAAVAAVAWVVVVRTTHKASLASLVAVVVALAGVVVLRGAGTDTAIVTATALLVVARHAGNLTRLMRGEERSLRT